MGICVEYQGIARPYKNQKVAIYCTIVDRALRREISGPPHKNIHSFVEQASCLLSENGTISQFEQTVANKHPAQKPAITCDLTPPFRRNATAYPNSPNDFAKFAPDSYSPQNASAWKIEIEIENSPTIF